LLNQQPISKKSRIGTPGFWALIAVGALILIVVLAIVVDQALYYNKVHSGVSVAGISLSGQSQTEAVATVQAVVDKNQSTPITLTAADKSWTLLPTAVGATMNVEEAVKSAMNVTREHNIFSDIVTRWKLYFSKQDVPLTGTVDEAKMQAFVGDIAKQIDVAPVNAALSIENGQIRVIDSVQGKVVDQTALSGSLKSLLVALHSTTVPVPVVVKEPAVKAEDNAEAQKQAETMISGPVSVVHGDKSWAVTAQEIASYMSFKAEDKNGVSTLVPFMDASKLQPLLTQIAPDVASEPVDAKFAHDDTKAWVVPGQDGEQIDTEATAQAITGATLKSGDRSVQVVTKKKEPDLTTAEAEAMGITTKLNSYTTTYNCPANRRTNVKLATQYSTNVFMAPGDEFNFDKQIGPRTTARGWKLAPGITGPNELEDVLGGGICQVSTTMFNAIGGGAAGLKITERHNHSLYISHYPKGRDATVTGGGKNLRFVNDMDHYVWITGTSTGVTTTITVWGTDEGRSTQWQVGSFYNVVGVRKTTITDKNMLAGKTKSSEGGQTGKSLKTVRIVTANGKTIHNDTFISVWPMYPATVIVGTGTTSTTKPTSSSTTASTSPPSS
jgi:vancomycin resistance protein YoaR